MNYGHAIEQLKAALDGRETVPAEWAHKVFEVLDRAPDEALILLRDGKVKFLSQAADMRLRERGVTP
jgi:hypothetical protein